uniref:N-acetylglucosamine-6-phosphate deacetylase n=1 Tax=Sinocyclocheilus grahami TaxID=75366 RepID=A0A672JT40_SINGR
TSSFLCSLVLIFYFIFEFFLMILLPVVSGIHLEGPFISEEKRGAHPSKFLRTFKAGGVANLMETYGYLDNVAMVTLAPELANSAAAIRELSGRGIAVSLGHSMADLSQAEEAVQHGATFITHLFNAMLPFHHRDPGIVGLLTSDRVPPGRTVYYGMIADGIHTHPAALRIAHRAHPAGLVLVTDAVMAMGLPPGRHTLGQQQIDIQGLHAYVAGLRHVLSAFSVFGEIHYGCCFVDFIVLDDTLTLRETYIAGQQVWRK